MVGSVRIIGLDPGLRHTGWGIIQSCGSKLSHVSNGVISPPQNLQFSERLSFLFSNLLKVLEEYSPDTSAVEEVFVNMNPSSTLKLGSARGVVVLAPAHYGISVGEYSTNTIKKATVGSGHADKKQIQYMIKYLLPNCGELTSDSADALAVAICHAHNNETQLKIRNSI